ncbi:hypothetical protein [Streptomyces paradoxus]|uniref:hypothetical protein n=1 Tax=Streptomyces paradoxus TaxID=66375 RepID=UPI0037F74C76
MKTLAGEWWASGAFWQFAITTFIAVVIGALGAYATIRANNPKRRLDFGVVTNSSLFVTSHEQTGALSVTCNGTPVARPRIIDLELRNAGRRAITEAQFHGGDPIKFDLGANVVAVLAVSSRPTGSIAPDVRVDPSSSQVIQIPASLLAPRQRVRISILVDGPRADVECLAAPLVDVAIRHAELFDANRQHTLSVRAAHSGLVLTLVAMLVADWVIR